MIKTYGGTPVLPGDFAAVHMRDSTSRLIHIGEILNGDGFADYEHAITYLGGAQDLILEAEPGGAKITPMHYSAESCLWSSDSASLNLSTEQRGRVLGIAKALQGTPYSWLDYLALASHRLHIPGLPIWPRYEIGVSPPHISGFCALKTFIADTGHEICSQMVDTVRLMNRFHLFDDGRWPGYVTPADIANRIIYA
jgi:hypothetical protein